MQRRLSIYVSMYTDWTWLLLMGLLNVPKSWKQQSWHDYDWISISTWYHMWQANCFTSAYHYSIKARKSRPYFPSSSLIFTTLEFGTIRNAFPMHLSMRHLELQGNNVTVTHRKAAPWPKPYLRHLRNQKPFRLFRLRSRKCVPSHPGRKH